MSYNKVIVLGNLTKDPEHKEVGGTDLCTFTLAINRKYKGKTGSLTEEVLFLDVETWGATARVCGQYLAKGKKLLAEGFLKQNSWEAQDGTKRSKILLKAENVTFIGSNKKDEEPMRDPYTGQSGLPF